MITDYIHIMKQSMLNRKLRTMLTLIGIVIGITIIVLLISLGNGMQYAVAAQFEKMGIKSIRVVPAHLHGPPTGEIGLDKDLQNHIENVRGVDYVNPNVLHFANVEYNREIQFIMTIGYDTDLSEKGFIDTDLQLRDGRFFLPHEKDSVIIGAGVADRVFNKKIHTKNSITINDKKLRVIGVLEETGIDVDNRLYIPLEMARELFGKKDLVNAFVVQILPGFNIDFVAEQIDKKLARVVDEESYDVFTPKQLLSQITSILDIIQAILVAIAAIALIVGAIGIANSMFTSVLERTKEIGVMKAVGATNMQITLFFLGEAGVIGLMGGVMGIVIGLIIAFLINSGAAAVGFVFLEVTIDISLILFSLGFSLLIGLVAGIIPAIRASQLHPVDALRYE